MVIIWKHENICESRLKMFILLAFMSFLHHIIIIFCFVNSNQSFLIVHLTKIAFYGYSIYRYLMKWVATVCTQEIKLRHILSNIFIVFSW